MDTSSLTTPCQDWLAEERGRASNCARALGISRSHLSNIASGRHRPGNELLIKLHKFSGLSLDKLLAPWTEEDNGHDTGLAANDSAPLPQSPGDCEAAS